MSSQWQYYFARKFSPSRYENVMRVFFSEYYRKNFNAQLKDVLVKPSETNHAVYYIQEQWDIFADKVYKGSCKDLKTFNFYVKEIKTTQKKALKEAQSIIKQPLNNLSWKELGKLWERWDEAFFQHNLKPIWIPFTIEPLLSTDANKILEKLDKNLFSKTNRTPFEVVFSPDAPNAITSERIALLELALKVKLNKVKDLKEELEKHAEKFGFIPCYDVIDSPWDIKYFQNELDKILRSSIPHIEEPLKKAKKQFKINKLEFLDFVKKVQTKITKQDLDLLKMAHDLVFIKDERDDYRRLLSYTIQPLFRELAKRYHLEYRMPLYMIGNEMKQWFSTEKLPVSSEKLNERMKGYCIMVLNSQPAKVISGKEMQDFISTQQFTGENIKDNQIKGLSGSAGVIKGEVVIVYTKHDLRKITEGQILVSVTTNPDYVPAMRKCLAFVTDEGGITCHAAIVAREMKKPCIVGTKTATKILKDGDTVEVDANKGTVKILKQN